MTPPTPHTRNARAIRPHRTGRAWAVAGLMLICIVTAAILYNGALSIPIGHRHTYRTHPRLRRVRAPGTDPAGPAFPGLPADLGRLNRFTPSDWRWLRSRQRRDGTIRVGKFNAGQKLNAALTAGAILVLLGTGTLMYFIGLVRLYLAHGRDLRARLVRPRARDCWSSVTSTSRSRTPRPGEGCAPAESRLVGPARSTRRGSMNSAPTRIRRRAATFVSETIESEKLCSLTDKSEYYWRYRAVLAAKRCK